MTDATGHIVNLYFPFVEVETMLTLLDMAQFMCRLDLHVQQALHNRRMF